jgi:hypothetical protein
MSDKKLSFMTGARALITMASEEPPPRTAQNACA